MADGGSPFDGGRFHYVKLGPDPEEKPEPGVEPDKVAADQDEPDQVAADQDQVETDQISDDYAGVDRVEPNGTESDWVEADEAETEWVAETAETASSDPIPPSPAAQERRSVPPPWPGARPAVEREAPAAARVPPDATSAPAASAPAASAPATSAPTTRKRGRVLDRVIGILLGLVLGVGIVTAYVFLGSEETIDAPRVQTEGQQQSQQQQGQQTPGTSPQQQRGAEGR